MSNIGEKLRERDNKLLAQGFVGTNSKRHTQYPANFPTHLTAAAGHRVWDVNGNNYIDYIGGLGSCILGYGHPAVSREVKRQIDSGITTASLPCVLAGEVAEMVSEMIPDIEQVRFLKTGSEACSAALRIARAHVGSDYVYSDGYHGWHDEFISCTKPALGVHERDWISNEDYGQRISIVEPLGLDETKRPRPAEFLIADEIITGFRYYKNSVSTAWELKPDLITLGKSLGNGYPIALVGGKREVMSGSEYFVSSTFSDEAIGLAAARATLNELKQRKLDDLMFYAKRFMAALNETIKPLGIKVEGYGTRGLYPITTTNGSLFAQQMCKMGVLFGKAFFYHYGHLEAEEDDLVLNMATDVVQQIQRGECELEGPAPTETFKR